jgi:hypothetical protein
MTPNGVADFDFHVTKELVPRFAYFSVAIAVVHNFVRNAQACMVVTPAKAGVQNILEYLDSGVRRNDGTRVPRIGQNFWHLLY